MIKFEKRKDASKLFVLSAPFLSVILALITAGIIMLFADVNPIRHIQG